MVDYRKMNRMSNPSMHESRESMAQEHAEHHMILPNAAYPHQMAAVRRHVLGTRKI